MQYFKIIGGLTVIYAIAYSDINGKNFCSTLPWILSDFTSEANVRENVAYLICKGYKNVIPFKFKEKEKEEEFNWDYVNLHKI